MHTLKYLRFTTLGSKEIGIKKSECGKDSISLQLFFRGFENFQNVQQDLSFLIDSDWSRNILKTKCRNTWTLIFIKFYIIVALGM